MKKLLLLIMTLVMILSLAACGGGDTQEAADTNANPPAKEEWQYKDVTPEQIQAISDVLVTLEPLYNEAATAAMKNGWEEDETVVQELNVIYALIDSAKHGVADPSEYEGAKDMASVVEQYQAVLGTMSDLIAKVSGPYSK